MPCLLTSFLVVEISAIAGKSWRLESVRGCVTAQACDGSRSRLDWATVIISDISWIMLVDSRLKVEIDGKRSTVVVFESARNLSRLT